MHRATQLAHHLLQLRVCARSVDDPRHAPVAAAATAARPEGRRQTRGPRCACRDVRRRRTLPLDLRAPPPKGRAQQAERLASASWALKQCVGAVLEREHDLFHVHELDRVGLEGEVDRASRDVIRWHRKRDAVSSRFVCARRAKAPNQRRIGSVVSVQCLDRTGEEKLLLPTHPSRSNARSPRAGPLTIAGSASTRGTLCAAQSTLYCSCVTGTSR